MKLISKYLLIPLITIIIFSNCYRLIKGSLFGLGYGFNLIYYKFEILLVISIYYSVFSILTDNIYRYFIAILPIALYYVFYDYYFISFGKVFKLCDLSEIPELLDVLPFWQIAGYSFIIIIPIIILIINSSRLWVNYIFPIGYIALIFFIINFNPTLYLKIYEYLATVKYAFWTERESARNGYIATTLYFEAMMNNSYNLASKLYGDGIEYEKSQADLTEYLNNNKNSRNIHVIVLESFFNPQLFANISYDKSIYHATFSSLINDKESTIISPVFGGFTAEAEFEVLCGVPALHKYNTIEFNGFRREKVFCLPTLLNNIGYRTTGSNSYKPMFFNEATAYRGLGFSESYFPQQYAPKMETYLKLVDDTEFIFDSDLFSQNIEYVKKHLRTPDHKPLFNYVLGIYGHMPFKLDEKRHPIILKAQSDKKLLNDEFQRASNQIYYRTEALADYLKQLMLLDPDSIIVVMGDHVPKLGGQPFYKEMAYRNNIEDSIHQTSVFYIINSEVVQKDTAHQYDIVNIIYDYITDNRYCKNYSCKRSEKVLNYQYDMIMAKALR